MCVRARLCVWHYNGLSEREGEEWEYVCDWTWWVSVLIGCWSTSGLTEGVQEHNNKGAWVSRCQITGIKPCDSA